MAATPQPWKALSDRIYRIEEAIKRLQQSFSSFLTGMGLSVPASGVTQVDGALNVVGDETVSGNLTVSGALVLPNGSVNNEWLVSPVSPQAVYDSVQNFSLSTTLTNIRTTNVTIPSGFTKAAVQLTVRAYATNPNTTGGNNGSGGDYLYAQANINGFNGYALPTGVSGSNGSGTNVSTFAIVLTGLTPGATISLQCAVQTGFLSWAANANNTVDLSASIGWYR